MLGFLHRVITKIWPSSNSSRSLEDDWIILLSDHEIQFKTFAENNQNQLDDELATLRKRNSAPNRLLIIKQLSATFAEYDLGEAKTVTLSSDLRGKIYKDVFNQLSDVWIHGINEIYGKIAKLEENWKPSLYQKNILGQMIDMADRTSPETLTVKGLVQTIKNVHLCLYSELRAIGVESNEEQSQELLHLILKMIIPVVTLWCKTVKNSRHGIAQEGKLPIKWAKEDQKRKEQLDDLKATGKIDQRYADGTLDLVRKNYLVKDEAEALLSEETLQERQRQLEKNLKRGIFRKSSPEMPFMDDDVNESRKMRFKEAQSELTKNLQFNLRK
jgi:hypothetical protein